VVARQAVDRHRQRAEQLQGALVLGRIAGVGDVAGEEDGGGQRVERQHAGDGRGERVLGDRLAEAEVRVAELRDQGRGHTSEA